MERLIKQYFRFFDETLHQERFFPNLLFNFHHLNVLIHQYYFRTPWSDIKNQQNKSFCWFFFVSLQLKNFI
jgi:hypothetical protein